MLSSPILIALYNNSRAQGTLALLSLAIIFVCTVSVSTAILQASGHVFIPVRNMLIGGLFKVISNYILIAIPQLNIGGAPISTFFCYFIIVALNIISIIRIIKPKFNIKDFIVKPLVSTFVMGVVVYLVYNLTAAILGCPEISLSVDFMSQSVPVTPVATAIRFKTIIALGMSIVFGVIAYVISMGVTRGFFEEDIDMLPKGKRILIIMKRIKLL